MNLITTDKVFDIDRDGKISPLKGSIHDPDLFKAKRFAYIKLNTTVYFQAAVNRKEKVLAIKYIPVMHPEDRNFAVDLFSVDIDSIFVDVLKKNKIVEIAKKELIHAEKISVLQIELIQSVMNLLKEAITRSYCDELKDWFIELNNINR